MIPSLGNHLWQTTVFVLGAALLARAVGSRHPAVRHGIWLAASCKFLVPFSLLVAAGQQIAGARLPGLQVPALPAAFATAAQPFSGWTVEITALAVADAGAEPARLWWIVPAAIWLMGAAATAGLRVAQRLRAAAIAARSPVLRSGREMEALRRVTDQFGLRRAVTIRATAGGVGPGVLGIFRPVLLWPSGLSARLTDAGLAAIIGHEIAHVRRADNLTSFIHTAVEVLFWFHPLVWWLGSKIVDDRERACDRAALALGARPRAYAESLLHVCRFCLQSPQPALAGISGSDLTQRVEAIMTYRPEHVLGFGRRFLLTMIAVLILAGPVIAGAVTSPPLESQQPSVEVPVAVEVPIAVEVPRAVPAAVPVPVTSVLPVRVEAPVAVQVQTPPRDPLPVQSSQTDEDEAFRRGALPATGTPGLTPPAVRRYVKPDYTREAMREQIQGSVELEVVIAPDGTVARARVVKSLDPVFGLDESALEAARRWTFEPARLNGEPVEVWASLVLDFRLR